MAAKKDNTMLILGGLAVAYFLFKPKGSSVTPYKTAYLPTSTNPTGSTNASPVNNIVAAVSSLIPNIVQAFKGNSPVLTQGIDTYAKNPVHINDNIDYGDSSYAYNDSQPAQDNVMLAMQRDSPTEFDYNNPLGWY